MNARLKKIADLIDDEAFSLDIGCDHAKLDIYLVQEKGHKKVASSDNKEGPLEKAKENIKKANCEDAIELLLGDGLDVYHRGIDTVVISGMGGYQMLKILKQGKKHLPSIKTLLLSPNNFIPKVRMEVSKLGYKIVEEELVQEKNMVYTILKFERGKKKLSSKDAFFGPILRKKRDALFLAQLEREQKAKELLLNLMPKKLSKRRHTLKKELKWIQEEK